MQKRFIKIAKNILSDWISKEDSPFIPTENGPWHETPKGWSNEKIEESNGQEQTDRKNYVNDWINTVTDQTPEVLENPFDGEDWIFNNDVNEVYFLGYGNKKSVFKPVSSRDYNIRKSINTRKTSTAKREVIAFEISEKLGIGLVPPTFFIEHNLPGFVEDNGQRHYSNKQGSEQAFVEGLTWSSFGIQQGKEKIRELLKNKDFQRQLGMLSITDYLIGSTDRHGKNFIIDKDNRIHAIDNGLSFAMNGYEKENNFGQKGEFRSLPTDILFRINQDYDQDFSISNMQYEDYNTSEFVTDFDQLTRLQIIQDAGGFTSEVEQFFKELDYENAKEQISAISKYYGLDKIAERDMITRLNDIQDLFNN